MPGTHKIRYSILKIGHDDFWRVYDIFTGAPAELHGTFLTHCRFDDALADLGLLNTHYIAERNRRDRADGYPSSE